MGVVLIGVSDPDLSRAAPYAAKAGCLAFDDYLEMCARLKPDIAFALGRHCDMAEEARFLIDNRIPFAMEKPCALNAAEAQDIADRAAAAGVFAAVAMVFRTKEMKLNNVFFYPEFMHDTLARVRGGRKPIADLEDNAAAVTLIERAYAMSPLGQ